MQKCYVLLGCFCLGVTASCNKVTAVKHVEKVEEIVHTAHLGAGWYPQDKKMLEQEVARYVQQARRDFSFVADPHHVRALIVPHAGFYFSGLCAASAYQALWDGEHKNTAIKRVIILAPSHRIVLKGCALGKFTVYKTPLGDIPIDTQAYHMLEASQVFKGDARAHDQEHAIEIQLPFLQHVLADFSLVPIVVGHISDSNIDEILHGLKKIIDETTLVVISTDFMHQGASFGYTAGAQNIVHTVRAFDSMVINRLIAQDYAGLEKVMHEVNPTVCGQACLRLLLGMVNQGLLSGINIRLANYYTSVHMHKARLDKKDVIDTRMLLADPSDAEFQESVSYAALIATTQSYHEYKPEDKLTSYEKKSLIAVARRTIEHDLNAQGRPSSDELLYPVVGYGVHMPGGVFVTIHDGQGDLRGCIGSIVSSEPLYKSVVRLARQAAFHDTRFAPISKADMPGLRISISILTEPAPVEGPASIRLGIDGIILHKIDDRDNVVASSVFLPKVPQDMGWDITKTLEQLSLKAGLHRDAWKTSCRFLVFQAYEIGDFD